MFTDFTLLGSYSNPTRHTRHAVHINEWEKKSGQYQVESRPVDPGPTGGGKTHRKYNLQNIINIRRTKKFIYKLQKYRYREHIIIGFLKIQNLHKLRTGQKNRFIQNHH